MVFRLYQLNLLEEKEKILNQLILFTGQQKIQKFVHSVIIQNIFQKHIQIFMTKKVKQKELIVAMNAIIADLFLKKDRHKRHIENCAGVRGVVYNFNTKSLIRFQDKFHAKDDLPFV